MREGETDERLDAAADLPKGLIHAVNNGLDRLGGIIDQSRIEITSEIRSSRGEFTSHLDVRILMIEQDLAQIKAKLRI